MAAVASSSSMEQKLGPDFLSRYTLHEKLGKGHFAVVYRCVRNSDGQEFAVKLVDIRPLRLKDNFSRERLLREVSILEQLRHPHIVHLEEHLWNAPNGDHLLLVMEYSPGRELFDIIIQSGKFSEQDAKPIVAQLLSALAYCHKKEIMHRDVKPENIIVMDATRAQQQYGMNPIVKLLDFGLSRSGPANTFVGTPEYYAPEVDVKMRQGGIFGTYGVKADCWSIGAVIFVMLSGIFPEFTGEGTSKMVSFARASHWGDISDDAKSLIAKLMHPDPAQRIPTADALREPWLAGVTGIISHSESVETSEVKWGITVAPTESRKRMRTEEHPPDLASVSLEEDGFILQTNRLLALQHQIIKLLEQAYALYNTNRDCKSARTIRKHMIQVQKQFSESAGLMHKLGGTATNVLEVIPDIQLGVEEGVPDIAGEFFTMIKGWIADLKDSSQSIMHGNSSIIQELNASIHATKQGMITILDSPAELGVLGDPQTARRGSSMFPSPAPPEIVPLDSIIEKAGNNEQLSADELMNLACPEVRHRSSVYGPRPSDIGLESLESEQKDVEMSTPPRKSTDNAVGMADVAQATEACEGQLVCTPPRSPNNACAHLSTLDKQHLVHLAAALKKLGQVDQILSQFAMFWNHMETAVTLLLQKNQHVESLLRFAHNDKFRARFLQRLDRYKIMWSAIEAASKSYAMSSGVDPRDPLSSSSAPMMLVDNCS